MAKKNSEFLQPIKTERGKLTVSGHFGYTKRSQGFQCSAGTSSRDIRVLRRREKTSHGERLTTAIFLVAVAVPEFGLDPSVGPSW